MAGKLLSVFALLTTALALPRPDLQTLQLPSQNLTTPHITPENLTTLYLPVKSQTDSLLTANESTPTLGEWPGVPIRIYADDSIKSEYVEVIQYSDRFWDAAFNRAWYRSIQAALSQLYKEIPRSNYKSHYETYKAASGPVTFQLDAIEKELLTGWDIKQIIYCTVFLEARFGSPAGIAATYTKHDVELARFYLLLTVSE